MQNITPLIIVNNLYKSYKVENAENIEILKGMTFSISHGETVVIMGPSGTGKTTLLNILMGIEKPTSGNIEFGGKKFLEMNEEEKTDIRKTDIGVLFQFFELHKGLTCRETLEMCLIISDKKINDIYQSIEEILTDVGMLHLEDRLIDELSRGEKQRLAIARALIKKPQLFIADEPTGALDPETATTILNLLRKTIEKQKGTLIVATHDYSIIKDGDRILSVENGKISADNKNIQRIQYLKEKGLEQFVL